MIPGWKIKRELLRIAQQMRGVPERIIDPLRMRLLNSRVNAGLPRFEGEQSIRDKVAVVLVYQPDGLPGSLVHLCEWLVSKGYAPLIVSNTPLSDSDRKRISPVIWRCILRPNFGYDFGGYRDALTTLRLWSVEPQHLLIVNDSVWLPMLPDTDLIERGEAQPADIVGSVMRRRQEEVFLESYYFQLKGHVLRAPAFLRFWSELRLTSNKYYVIRRGERGFTRAMLKSGFTVAPLFGPEQLSELLAGRDVGFLEKTLEYSAIVEPEFLEARTDLLEAPARDEAWRQDAMDFIVRSLDKLQGYSSFPYAAVTLLGYPFLKKSTDPTAVAWRGAFVRAVEAGDIPSPPSSILAELKESVARSEPIRDR